MKMESLQQRREELERKEFQLKESLFRFDKFLKVLFYAFLKIHNSHKKIFNFYLLNFLFSFNIFLNIMIFVLGKRLETFACSEKSF